MKNSLCTDDLQLFRDLQDGDRDAFDIIFRKYYPLLCSYGSHLVPQEDAEEIVQDVFLWVWENKSHFPIDHSPKHYLLRMTHHRCMNRMLQNEAKLKADTIYYQRTLAALQDIDILQVYELSKRIDEAIRELPAPFREAFRMHRFQHLSHKEIAERLNVSPQTVNYRIGQAVKLLRIRFKDYLPILLLYLQCTRHTDLM